MFSLPLLLPLLDLTSIFNSFRDESRVSYVPPMWVLTCAYLLGVFLITYPSYFVLSVRQSFLTFTTLFAMGVNFLRVIFSAIVRISFPKLSLSSKHAFAFLGIVIPITLLTHSAAALFLGFLFLLIFGGSRKASFFLSFFFYSSIYLNISHPSSNIK